MHQLRRKLADKPNFAGTRRLESSKGCSCCLNFLMWREGQRILFRAAYFLDIALALEESCRTSMHFVEVGQILCPSDPFLDEEAEIFVKLDRGSRCKIKWALGIT